MLLITDKKSEIFRLLRLAGEAILDIYHDESTVLTTIKSDNSPVTAADIASDRIITEGLLTLWSEIPVISEESGDLSYAVRRNLDYCWILDPLDGTKEFIQKTDEFTINLGLIHQNKVVAGFIYLPVLGEMYYAIYGKGAFQVLADGRELRINVSQFSLASTGIRVLASRSHIDPGTKSIIDYLDRPEIIEKGSAIKFISIAKGEADYYPRLIHIMEWDTAAGQIIIEEAGGSLVDATTGAALMYNKSEFVNPHFIASGKIITQ